MSCSLDVISPLGTEAGTNAFCTDSLTARVASDTLDLISPRLSFGFWDGRSKTTHNATGLSGRGTLAASATSCKRSDALVVRARAVLAPDDSGFLISALIVGLDDLSGVWEPFPPPLPWLLDTD